ncbi:MAG: GDSL-type esterase/lipase family protein [Bacteroidota bacterium]
MLKLNLSLSLLLCLLIFNACDDEDQDCPNVVNEGAIRILPLGDSRVEGARPDFESYRYELWKQLIDSSWNVDFVGTRKDGANYEKHKGNCFDKDHEGTGGAVSADILQTVQQIAASDAPQAVLLGVGGNDLLDANLSPEQVLGNIRQIIDQLQSLNPEVTIFLEQIAPGKSAFMRPEWTNAFNAYNAGIPGVASEKSTDRSAIIVINMAAGWTDALLADDVHYNVQGAQLVAERYFEAMQANLTP